MSAVTEYDPIEEASALGETVDEMPSKLPIILPIFRFLQPDACDALWMPPCPVCSWIEVWRRSSLDRLETPGLWIARHTTAKFGKPHYIIRGCPHASELGVKIGPIMNRLWLAIAWRRKVAVLVADLQLTHRAKCSDEQRAEWSRRLGHPSMRLPLSS